MNQPPGTWSDDGSLMLCTIASYLEHKRLEADDLGKRFVRWYDEGYGGRVLTSARPPRRHWREQIRLDDKLRAMISEFACCVASGA